MVTMLDCIRRVAPITKEIVKNAQVNTDDMVSKLGDDVRKINEIVICGAGSSNTAAVTAAGFMEKVTGLQVHTFMANQFARKSIYNPDALYIFVSQTGTSTLVKEMVARMNDMGCFTVSVTEDETTPVGKQAKTHVNMGCGYEEYWFRTIGYCSSVVTLMVIGLRIALERGTVTVKEYNDYLAEAVVAADNHPAVIEKTIAWFNAHKDELVKGRCFVVYGSGPLHGVALEGALKVLETAKTFMAIGYEAEDGLHGPNLGFGKGEVIISLNDGVNDEWMGHGVVEYAKKELTQGYIFGAHPLDENDLEFEVKGGNFRALEFAAAVETLAYLLAKAVGTPVLPIGEYQDHISGKYFETHRG
ncbi:MAG: SIS domain-containing protein [Erysipelotrichaceae bacterium]|nr:SIS domain-containing protein [Erysipelotrichaceae bacterium]